MADGESIRERILRDIDSVTVSDACGTLLVCGQDAVVVVACEVDGRPEALVAAAPWGKGRVVAFGHEDMIELDEDSADGRKQLVLNALAWASNKDTDARVLVHGQSELAVWLEAQGCSAFDAEGAISDARRAAGKRDVIITNDATLSEEDRAAIEAFVTNGGGLLVAGTGWAHPHYGPKVRGRVAPMAQSALLAPSLGVIWDEETALPGDGSEEIDVEVDNELADRAHMGTEISAVTGWLSGDEDPPVDDALSIPVRSALRWIRAAARNGADWSALSAAIDEAFQEMQDELAPTPESPIDGDERWKRSVVFLQTARWKELPPDEVSACEATHDYPGAVSEDAEDEPCSLTVDGSVARWVSTGRYARPGTVFEVEVSEEALERGLRVRVGAHIDELYTDDDRTSGAKDDADYASDEGDWQRWPELSFEYPLTDVVTRVASPFGGLVYVVVAEDGEAGPYEVELRDCVAAPRFVLGETNVRDWQQSGRHAPAPWGEFECDRFVITFPSDALRPIDDPEAVMRFWDRALRCYEELSGVEYRRAERIVADRQPSLGYLHSGYPIVGLVDAEDQALFSILEPRKVVSDGAWGTLHELGHNVQQDAWTFDGTDEVTNNVFVLFVTEALCGVRPIEHPMLQEPLAKLKEHQRKGGKFARWKEDPFLALLMYAQVQAAFGWRPFIEVFAEYRGLSDDEQPKDDDDKRDQWLTRLSRRVGRDLGPFFERWGVPTSAEARKALKDLPVWGGPEEAE